MKVYFVASQRLSTKFLLNSTILCSKLSLFCIQCINILSLITVHQPSISSFPWISLSLLPIKISSNKFPQGIELLRCQRTLFLSSPPNKSNTQKSIYYQVMLKGYYLLWFATFRRFLEKQDAIPKLSSAKFTRHQRNHSSIHLWNS